MNILNHYCLQILRANIIGFTVEGNKELLRGSNIRPVVLKARSAGVDVPVTLDTLT